MGFNFDICYKPGSTNIPADALSRVDQGTLLALQAISKTLVVIWDALRNFYVTNIAAAKLLQCIQDSPAYFPHYTIKDGLLCFKSKVFVPLDFVFQSLILFGMHNSPLGGHARMKRTLSHIVSMFY